MSEESNARAIIDAIKTSYKADVHELNPSDLPHLEGGAFAIETSEGRHIQSGADLLAPWRLVPQRHRGVSRMADVDSLVGFTNRHKDGGSAIYADRSNCCIFVAINDHTPANAESKHPVPGFGDFGAMYSPKSHEDWLAWAKAAEGEMNQKRFAEFIEDRIGDVLAPEHVTGDAQAYFETAGVTPATAADLMAVSRGLTLRINREVSNAISLDNGAVQMTFAEGNTPMRGGASVVVPTAFAIGLRVFEGDDDRFVIPVRLRYREDGGKIIWRVILHRPSDAITTVFRERAEKVKAGTGLPLFYGIRISS